MLVVTLTPTTATPFHSCKSTFWALASSLNSSQADEADSTIGSRCPVLSSSSSSLSLNRAFPGQSELRLRKGNGADGDSQTGVSESDEIGKESSTLYGSTWSSSLSLTSSFASRSSNFTDQPKTRFRTLSGIDTDTPEERSESLHTSNLNGNNKYIVQHTRSTTESLDELVLNAPPEIASLVILTNRARAQEKTPSVLTRLGLIGDMIVIAVVVGLANMLGAPFAVLVLLGLATVLQAKAMRDHRLMPRVSFMA